MDPYCRNGEELDPSPRRRPVRTAPRVAVPVDLAGDDLALVLGEINHRIRNLLATVEMVVGQTRSTTVEDYRAKLTARISGLRGLYEMISRSDDRKFGIAELVEQTARPYCAKKNRLLARGPDLEIEPRLAFALHLVFHELATNASKYGALSSPRGSVTARWQVRKLPGQARRLEILWTEHGGPEVKPPQRRGFGSRLIPRALEPYGEVELTFDAKGLVCLMLIDMDAARCGRSTIDQPGDEPWPTPKRSRTSSSAAASRSTSRGSLRRRAVRPS